MPKPEQLTIGVLSDTHDVLNETVLRQLRGVDRILHAGDIVCRDILDQLRQIAPVTAVCGNCDPLEWGDELPRSLSTVIGGYRIFMIHDLGDGNPDNLSMGAYERWFRCDPQIAIFGHIHRPVNKEEKGVLYFNPGSPTRPRGGHVPTIGLLHLSPEAAVAEHISV